MLILKKSGHKYQKEMKLCKTSINVDETFGIYLIVTINHFNKFKNICLRISHWLDGLSKTLIYVMYSHLIKFN